MSILQVKNLSASIQSKIIFENISFEIKQGNNYAVTGSSGSGKTTLLKCIAGKCFYRGSIQSAANISVVFVEQQHHFKNLSNTSAFYYQQRFNSMDSEDALTVEEYLNYADLSKKAGEVFEILGINRVLVKRLIQLSNGENKRVQLAKALLQEPDILLLDNPFLGLDVEARKVLNKILESISIKGISIVMATSSEGIPDFITDVLELKGSKEFSWKSKEIFLKSHFPRLKQIKIDKDFLNHLLDDGKNDFSTAVNMNEVHVQYSDKIILEGINWEVKRGERWSLSGPNGAGKSTLLSLINADNPQAYANEIYLFDKRRGRGESIWDIKRKIGYISPELHLYFDSSIAAFEVVASGLFDTIGLFRVLNEEQIEKVKNWMKVLNVEDLASQLLVNLPLGKQRLILLSRALVKDPPLLLLDEPVQGLDVEQTYLFKNIIEQICEHSDKTLIYVTHLREEIPSCVTKFIRLEQGKITELVKQ